MAKWKLPPPPFSGRDRQAEDERIASDEFLRDALIRDKSEGQRYAVYARWAALAVVALLLPYLNFHWSVIYYEFLLLLLALIGWWQLQAAQIGLNKRELWLIYLDLIVITVSLVAPNPFDPREIPTAIVYKFGGFDFYYIILAAATLAYSWRTVAGFGTWVTICWGLSLALIINFGTQDPELGERVRQALAGEAHLLELLDPNDPRIEGRVQEIVVFFLVAHILALNGWRNNRLLFRQAEAAKERANLARYFSPTIVEEIAGHDKPLGEVRRQSVAVMFTDIVGFTRLAEKMPAEEIVEILRRFHAIMETAVFHNGGTLDKFLGDGVMATFGTPHARAEDARNALDCAGEMFAAMETWNAERRQQNQEEIRLSIGLHFGEVVLGDIGSERRLEYAVLGDAVNVASRLESLTRELGVRMTVSEELIIQARTHGEEAGPALLQQLNASESRQLRGREDPVKIWTC